MQFADVVRFHHEGSTGFSRHYLTLYSIVLGLEAQSVYEFGAGRSSQVILTALQHTGGRLISCDQRELSGTGLNTALITEAGGQWQYVQGDSLDHVPILPKDLAFDLVLHDGSHARDIVTKDLRNILPHMKQDGLILVHDTAHHDKGDNLSPAVIDAMGGVQHSRVTLPYGYGLTIVRIEQDFGHGSIELDWQKGDAVKEAI